MSDSNATKHTLAANLNKLMAANLSLNSNPKLAKRSGLGLGTIARTRNADVSVNLDTLDSLATCFDLQPWQLLVPKLDPLHPPVLRSLSSAEAELFERLRSVIVEQSKPA
jgi:transcriptional regulator with XRE-family HTH domain